MDGGENAHRNVLWNQVDIGLALIRETDPIQAADCLSSQRLTSDLIHREAEIGNDLFKRYAAVVHEPLFGTCHCLSFH